MNRNVKWIAIALCLARAALLLAACGGDNAPASYKDGTYEGQSEPHEGDEEGNGDGYGVVSLTLKDNRIVACEFTTYELDGTLKDENYGMVRGEIANKDFYNKAQKAIQAAAVYAGQLVETGDIDKVDAISGATYNYNDFKDAVRDALGKAKQ